MKSENMNTHRLSESREIANAVLDQLTDEDQWFVFKFTEKTHPDDHEVVAIGRLDHISLMAMLEYIVEICGTQEIYALLAVMGNGQVKADDTYWPGIVH